MIRIYFSKLKNGNLEITEKMLNDILSHMKIQDNEIKRLNNIIFELREKNRNLLEDNMRLRKELNLHSGKLYISDIEVKNVF